MGLTAKQKKFIDEYIRTGHITRSAIAAGYSEKTAYSIGSENLRKPEIAEEISRRTDEMAMPANEVLMRLAKQARADMRDFLAVGDAGVEVDLTYALDEGITDLIKKISHRKTRTIKDDSVYEETYIQLELHDAHAALVDIGRHHALFTDKTEQKIDGNVQVEYVNDWRDTYGKDSITLPSSGTNGGEANSSPS